MNAPEPIIISTLLNEQAILLNQREPKKNIFLKDICYKLAQIYQKIHPDRSLEHIIERENDLSTGIGNHVAIPHALSREASDIYLLFATHRGLKYDSLDGKPVKIIFLLAIPPEKKVMYGNLLMKVSKILRETSFRDKLLHAKTPEAIIKYFKEIESIG